MNRFVRLTLLSLAMVILLSLYFEYCVNRPLNIYIQYAATAVILIISGFFLVYLVKQIIQLLNP